MNWIDRAAMIVSECLTIWVLSRMVKNDLRRAIPVFWVYVLYSAIAALLRMAVSFQYAWFFYTFWSTEAIYLLLVPLCVYQSYSSTFSGMLLLPWFKKLFPTLCVAVVLYAGWKAIVHPPLESSFLLDVIIGVEIGVQYLVAGTFLLFTAASAWLKLSYGRHDRAVVVGFGISSLGMLLSMLVRSEFGTRYVSLAKYVPTVAYILALVIWSSAFDTPLPDREPDGPVGWTAGSAIEELEKYETTLRKTGQWDS
jgi:hypothetical protein